MNTVLTITGCALSIVPLTLSIADDPGQNKHKIIHKIAPVFALLSLIISTLIWFHLFKTNPAAWRAAIKPMQTFMAKGIWHILLLSLFLSLIPLTLIGVMHGLGIELAYLHKPYKKSLPIAIEHCSMYLSTVLIISYMVFQF